MDSINTAGKEINSPINEEKSQIEFKRCEPWIIDSIKENHLAISPEQFWLKFRESIQFIPFDKYLSLVDMIIAKHANEKKIICYYHQQDKFAYEGPIANSENFMIRLLNERIVDKGLHIDIEIVTKDIMQSGKGPKDLLIVDVAIYSGIQKREDIFDIPADTRITIFIVAGVPEGIEKVKEARTRNSIKTPLEVLCAQELRPIKDQVNPETSIILRRIVLEKMKRVFGTFQAQKMAERFMENSLTINPFKLPDSVSTAASLFGDMFVTPKESGYIDPKYLLDTTNSKPIKKYSSGLGLNNLFKRLHK